MKLSEARVLFLARESLAKLREEGLAEISNFDHQAKIEMPVVEAENHLPLAL